MADFSSQTGNGESIQPTVARKSSNMINGVSVVMLFNIKKSKNLKVEDTSHHFYSIALGRTIQEGEEKHMGK